MYTLFPPIQPYDTFQLSVSDIHTLHIEQSGNPGGIPVVFLHGGPGAGFSAKHRQIFDPKKYRTVLFDQRGAGKSTPHACLEDNTTWHLVEDMETIRHKLGIEKWLVFGGSWGSTLALAYAETHPDVVSGLILRGIFLTREEEIQWFYQAGAHVLYPDLWEAYLRPVPPEARHNMVHAYYALLTDADEKIRLNAARAWSGWEGSTIRLLPKQYAEPTHESDLIDLAMARIECHYFMHDSFLEPNQLIKNIDCIRHIPTWIVHGRYDVVCPVKSAWDLHRAFPEAQLSIIPDAGHAFDEPGITDALMTALAEFKP